MTYNKISLINKQATIIKIEELPKLRRSLPKSWIRAAGLLRHKKGIGKTSKKGLD